MLFSLVLLVQTSSGLDLLEFLWLFQKTDAIPSLYDFLQEFMKFACLIYCFELSLAISDYKQSLQFQTLNEEKQNIHLEVRLKGVDVAL